MSTEDPFETMARAIEANTKSAAELNAAAKAISVGARATVIEAGKAVETIRTAVAGLTPESATRALSEALAGIQRDATVLTTVAQRLEAAGERLAWNRWMAWGGAVFLLVLAGMAGWVGWTFGAQHERQTIGDEKAALAWSGTKEGQAAWRLSRVNEGLMERLTRCSSPGWKTEKRDGWVMCWPYATGKGTYGWAVARDD